MMQLKQINKEFITFAIVGFIGIIIHILIALILNFAQLNNDILPYIYRHFSIIEIPFVAILSLFFAITLDSKPDIKKYLLLSTCYLSYILIGIILAFILVIISIITVIGGFALFMYLHTLNDNIIKVIAVYSILKFLYVFATIFITNNLVYSCKKIIMSIKNRDYSLNLLLRPLLCLVLIPVSFIAYNFVYVQMNNIITKSVFYVGSKYYGESPQVTLHNGDTVALVPKQNALEFYDIELNKTFLISTRIAIPTNWERVAVLPDNKVLFYGGVTFVGGHGEKIIDKSSFIFDPNDKTFKRSGDVKYLFNAPKIVVFPNGKILFVNSRNMTNSKDVQIFDEKTNTYTVKKMLFPICTAGGINLNNNKVLIYGVQKNGENNFQLKTQLYNLNTDSFEPTINQPVSKDLSCSIVLKNGDILIIGYQSQDNKKQETVQVIELYNPTLNKFITLDTNLNYLRKYPNLTLLKNGNVLISAGGNDQTYIKNSEIYNPKTKKSILIGDTPKRLFNVYNSDNTYELPNGNILFIGGSEGHSDGTKRLKSIEMFDLQSNTFRTIGNMRKIRENPTVIPLDNNKIMIYGGDDSDRFPFERQSAEILNINKHF